jgi:hypothetical protein
MTLKIPAKTAPTTAGITRAMATYSHWAEKGWPGDAVLCEIFANQEKNSIVHLFKKSSCDYLANSRTWRPAPAKAVISLMIQNKQCLLPPPPLPLWLRHFARAFYTL